MKQFKILMAVMLSVFFLTSCSDDENKEKCDAMSYSQVLTSLVQEDTNLDKISQATHVSTDQLIKMKYGVIAENEDLTGYLRELKYCYMEGDQDDIQDMLEEDDTYEISSAENWNKVDRLSYKKGEYTRNEELQQKLPVIGTNVYNKKIENFIEDKYSIIGVFVNMWDYVWNSKEEYMAKFKGELESDMKSVDLNKLMQERIQAYADMLNKEHEVLFGVKANTEAVNAELNIENMEFELDHETQTKLIDHALIDLYDFGMDVAEETVFALIIWAVIAIIIEITIRRCVKNETEEIFRMLHKKSDGFLKTAGKLILSAVMGASEEERKKQEIRDKWNYRKRWISGFVTVAVFVWGYFYVMKPSAEIELVVEENMKSQTADYFNSLDLWVITELNQITDKL